MKTLPRSVYRAINAEVTPSFNRWARKNYRMSGKRLIAKVYAGEGGGSIDEGTAKTSSAGAYGPGQFIRSTRDAYVKQYGIDPWKNDRSAVRGTIKHLMGTGVAGYNPGMPTYESYILGQKVDTRPLRNGKAQRVGAPGIPGGELTSTSRIPGLDRSADRQQAKIDYLSQRGRPGALLELGLQLKGLQDIPGGTVTSRTATRGYDPANPRAGDGHPINQILQNARQWARARPKYVWGGGHGAIAKVGDGVDCSGFVSSLIGLKTPMVSGQLMSWGKPGPGRWLTVYASPTHTFVSVRDPKTKKLRFFGTSRMGKNPNGGVTEFHPSASYLKGFTARHPG